MPFSVGAGSGGIKKLSIRQTHIIRKEREVSDIEIQIGSGCRMQGDAGREGTCQGHGRYRDGAVFI